MGVVDERGGRVKRKHDYHNLRVCLRDLGKCVMQLNF